MDDSTNIIDFRQRTGKPIPPPNPTPHRLVQRRRPLAEETPWEDPELEEMLGFPVRVPNLRRQVQKEKKEEDQIEKEIDLMQKYREKPLLFWKDELGIPINIWPNDKPPRDWEPGDPVPLWSKQREIINALVQHRKVAVKSGHGVGKCRGWYDWILLGDGTFESAFNLI